MQYTREIEVGGHYDILVAGAGPAGLSAAVSAARLGKKVALIERNGIVGGNLTSGFVGPLMGEYAKGSISEELNQMLNECSRKHHNVEEAKIKLTKWIDHENIDLYLQCPVVDVVMDENTITGVIISSGAGLSAITANIVIDATGDGNVAFLAGAPTEMGREDGRVQPASIMFTVENVDKAQTIVCRHEEQDTELPNGRYLQLCREAHQNGELPENVNIVRLYPTAYSNTERMVNATQANGINGLNPRELAVANLDLRQQMEMVVEFLRKNVWGFENCRIKDSAEMVGIRETRRVMGEYLLTAEDLVNAKHFDTAVVHRAKFPIDIHNPSGAGQAESDTVPVQVKKPYDIPYEVLVPLKVENLLTCGRCISGTHRAHASYRVMNIAAATGQAAGIAAALCVENGTSPRKLEAKKIQDVLVDIGVQLFD